MLEARHRRSPGARTYVGNTEASHLFLPRRHAGWDPTMTDGEVYDAARGWWRLNARAEQWRCAVFGW
jgi:hypothetical protein